MAEVTRIRGRIVRVRRVESEGHRLSRGPAGSWCLKRCIFDDTKKNKEERKTHLQVCFWYTTTIKMLVSNISCFYLFQSTFYIRNQTISIFLLLYLSQLGVAPWTQSTLSILFCLLIWWPMNRWKLPNTPCKYTQACTYEHGYRDGQPARYFSHNCNLNAMPSSARGEDFIPASPIFIRISALRGGGGEVEEEVGTRMWNWCPSDPTEPKCHALSLCCRKKPLCVYIYIICSPWRDI